MNLESNKKGQLLASSPWFRHGIETITFRDTNSLIEDATILDRMYILCQSCGEEFNNLAKGVQYSSTTREFLAFCSDECCKDYLNSIIR